MAGSQRRQRQENQASQLLNNDENNTLFQLIGNRCCSLASAVVQVYLADPPSCQKWNKRCCGVATFIKDNLKRSYYIRVYDIKGQKLIWEQELYNQFKYRSPRPYFHTFDADNCPAGLNFANESEAEAFKRAITDKLQSKQQRKTVKRVENGGAGVNQGRPPPPPATIRSGPAPSPPSSVNSSVSSFPIPVHNVPAHPTGTLKQDKKSSKGKKVKISKDDIGTPTDFRHVQHVGWDAEKKAFDLDSLDKDMKALFDDIGVTQSQLRDSETATFIYQFIEQHGGLQAVKEDRQQRAAGRPPPPPAPSMPAPPPPGRVPPAVPAPNFAPPPPNRGPPPRVTAPPPPHRPAGGVAPPPPPGPPQRCPPPSAAPPPPPPPAAAASVGAPPPPPPPPPPQMSGPPPPPGPPPAPAGGRANLLEEIQSGGGHALRHVEQQSGGGSGSCEPEGRDALLASIRDGASLKHVGQATNERPKSVAEEGGLAGALMKALKAREAALRPDEDDDEDEEAFDEDDWEE